MAKNNTLNSLFVFFLILSFLLVIIASIPLCVGASPDSGSLDKAEKANIHLSASQMIPDSLDYKASESITFKFGLRQAVRLKLPNMLICPSDLPIPAITASSIFLMFFPCEIYPQLSSIKIAGYLHAKDGML